MGDAKGEERDQQGPQARSVGVGVAAAAPILLYAVAPPLSARLGVDLTGGARTVPYRGSSYFLRPWKAGVTGPMRYADEALAVVGPGDHVFADFTLARVFGTDNMSQVPLATPSSRSTRTSAAVIPRVSWGRWIRRWRGDACSSPMTNPITTSSRLSASGSS